MWYSWEALPLAFTSLTKTNLEILNFLTKTESRRIQEIISPRIRKIPIINTKIGRHEFNWFHSMTALNHESNQVLTIQKLNDSYSSIIHNACIFIQYYSIQCHIDKKTMPSFACKTNAFIKESDDTRVTTVRTVFVEVWDGTS